MFDKAKQVLVAGAKMAMDAVAGEVGDDRRHAIMIEEAEKLPAGVVKRHKVPVRHRGLSNEPNDAMVAQVLEAIPTDNPTALVLTIIGRMGFSSIQDYDRAATRAERWVANNRNTRKRMPSHIRQKYALKALVERCLAEQFGATKVAKA